MDNLATDKERVINIFQYLKENQMLNYQPISNLASYDYALPETRIVDLLASDSDDIEFEKPEFLLRIRNVKLPTPLSIPKAISAWVSYDTEYELTVKEYLIERIKKPIDLSKAVKNKFEEYKNSGSPHNIPSELQGCIDFSGRQPVLMEYEIVEQKIILEDQPDIYKAVNDFHTDYLRWKAEYNRKSQIKKLHNDMYGKYQRLLIESDKYELLWCFGLLKWNNINRHMFGANLDISFDPASADIIIRKTDAAPKYEDDMLNDIEHENKDIYYRFRSELISTLSTIDCSDYEFCSEYLRNTVHYLDINGTVYEKENDVPDRLHPRLCYSPYLIFRERTATMWVEEFDRIIDHIKEDGTTVPIPLNILVNPELIDQASSDSTAESTVHSDNDDELLFPLPTNEEQREIATRLSRSPGVVVQGPPGTGKSHAIANLICHLLANGQRVLIASQKGHPLKIIKQKMPEKLRNLAVFLGDNSSSSYDETRRSVEYIANVISNPNVDALNKEIDSYRNHWTNISEEIAQTEAYFKRANELDRQTVISSGEEYDSVRAAKWVFDNSHLHGIDDYIDINGNPPLNLSEYQDLIAKLIGMVYADYHQLGLDLPNLDEIPSFAEFERSATEYNIANSRTIEAKRQLEEFNINDQMLKTTSINDDALDIALAKVNSLVNILDKKGIQDKMIPELLQEEAYFSEKLQGLLNSLQGLKELIMEDERHLFTNTVRVENQGVTQQMLRDIEEMLQKNALPNSFLKKMLYASKRYIFEDILVNGSKIDSIDKLQVARGYVSSRLSYETASFNWRSFLDFYGVQHNLQGINLIELNDIIAWLNTLLCARGYLREIEEAIRELGSKKLIANVVLDLEKLNSVKSCILAIQDRLLCLKAEEFFDQLICTLSAKDEQNDVSDYWKTLRNAAYAKDHELWYQNIKEIQRICGLKEDYDKINLLIDRMNSTLPIYTSKLMAAYRSGQVNADDKYLDRFKWKKLDDWLKRIDELLLQLPEKQEHLENLRHKENTVKIQLIESLARKRLMENVTGPERASLLAWLDYIRRGGKGTTTRTREYLRLAQQEIKRCVTAIPVFIMPVAKVIENIDVRDSKVFDVLIVDESSQCDLRSLSLLMRAKKIIIVGDDRQISPTRISSSEKETELIDKHLFSIPHRQTFDMRSSLYDKAKFMFKKHIMLKEHFRCVPEIIQFSNDLMYDGQIIPLRVPKYKERIEPPVKVVYVEKGFRKGDTNPPEAAAILSMVQQYCADPAYAKRTMGIISLQGDDQANLINELIYANLAKSEIETRKLIAGDAYHFQGDERDVIFMSMVIATEGDKRITALTQEYNLQRFNVASSRARDEMILFHSVRLSDLSTSCVRHRLLNYCKNPHRVFDLLNDVKGKFDSPFEEEVFKLLVAKGFYTRVQVPAGVGHKRIDLVVEGLANRLAIECDGDAFHGPEQYEADLERQRVLERAGWVFFRIRGSQFYRHREKSLMPLWSKLADMGIEPHSITT